MRVIERISAGELLLRSPPLLTRGAATLHVDIAPITLQATNRMFLRPTTGAVVKLLSSAAVRTLQVLIEKLSNHVGDA